MNLLAISDIDKNIMFVAMNDTIFVHRLNFNGKPSEPFKKLRYSTEPDYTNKVYDFILLLRNYSDFFF